MTVRLASDIGGTFTDVVLERDGALASLKVPTTPAAPERAVLAGAEDLLRAAGLGFGDVDVFLHGTTLATNAIIERRGARTALLATDGFRDVVEIADEGRFDQYDLSLVRTPPLVPRERRFTVPERMDVTGRVVVELDEAALETVARALRDAGIEALAIAFLHSYENPAHERRAGEILAALCPDLSITLSSDVCPEAREYERTSTAIANAFVQPLVAGYLGRLRDALAAAGCRGEVLLMTSGGHLSSLEAARRFPIRLVESGPAGGALLAAALAAERDEPAILSFDMGGTTAKICLIEDGVPLTARTFEVDRRARFMKGSGLPVRIPVIEMIEIGAGGGSIASLDGLGRLAVGPESAGSEPGPACYGRGGVRPTVTDADVLLGKIDPARFAGGRLELRPERAAAAFGDELESALGGDAVAAALAVAEVVDENMANAARTHAAERGVELAARTLVAFGGAAPLHAARLAEKLGIARVIVPPDAGVGSAVGFLGAPAAHEIVRSRYVRLAELDPRETNALLDDMRAAARAVVRTAAGGRALTERRVAFMRYAGQGHEIAVALPARALAAGDAGALRDAFEAAYREHFARHIPNAGIEIMSFSVTVSAPTSTPTRPAGTGASATPGARRAGGPPATRPVLDAGLRPGEGERWVRADVHVREALAPGDRVRGPALVVEEGTSTFVSSSFDATVDPRGALVLSRKGRGDGAAGGGTT